MKGIIIYAKGAMYCAITTAVVTVNVCEQAISCADNIYNMKK